MTDLFQRQLTEKLELESIYKKEFPDVLNFGKWIGMQCSLGFYTFYYREQDQEGYLITEDGNENTYDLNIPFNHKVNLISFARNHIDSEALDIRYIPVNTDDSFYDLIYKNSALVARSVIWEGGDTWENLGGAIIRFVITGTNAKKWKPRINIKFLEVPR